MRKVFKPLSATTNEKQWIGDTAPTPDGWFDGKSDSLADWKRRYPGRPPRAAEEATEEPAEVVSED